MTISIPVGPVAEQVTQGAQVAQVAEEYDWDAENGFSMGGELPEWRLVVAPARGIFHTMPLASENTGGTELGQIVAAGTLEQLAAFAADPPPRARLRPLSVAGAFHTEHMAPAVDALRTAAATVTVSDPRIALLSDRDGAVVTSGTDWLERIVGQVAAPVRWDQCQHTLAGLGVQALIELPPAGTLTGIARRALPGVVLQAVKSPDDLDAARKLVSEYGDDAGPGSANPTEGS